MLFLLWLLLLGLITYFILQRGVSHLTRTPVWVLWLVMMAPALIWSTWVLIYGDRKTMPPALAIVPFIVCPCLYWFLVQWGRKEPEKVTTEEAEQVGKAVNSATSLRPIDQAEEATLRDCFPWSVYVLRNLEYRPQAVICRGQLRTNPEAAYQTVRDKIEEHFGDRFLVLFQTAMNGQPFFALVPNPRSQTAQVAVKSEPLTRPFLALTLVAITLLTTTVCGTQIAGIPEKALPSDAGLLMQGLPYAIALMLILGVHESGHYLAARFYKIPTTLPYFIPFPFFIGTFGAFIQMRNPVPHRKALFDVSIAGPIAGLIVTIPILLWGLAHSTVVPLSAKSGLLNFESINPSFSLLLMLLSKATLGSALTAQKAIDLHPVAVAGYLGLVVTAFNLMPVGQLDGGHIVHAVFGQRTSMTIGQISRFLLLLLSLLEPGLLLWAILLFLMPLHDEPALNDVSELDNWRDFGGLIAIALLLAIILPAPKLLTQWFW
ncbi:MAG: site-2 protease family protein [Actinomycetota bacterium]